MDGNYFVLALEAYDHRYYYSVPLCGVGGCGQKWGRAILKERFLKKKSFIEEGIFYAEGIFHI